MNIDWLRSSLTNYYFVKFTLSLRRPLKIKRRPKIKKKNFRRALFFHFFIFCFCNMTAVSHRDLPRMRRNYISLHQAKRTRPAIHIRKKLSRKTAEALKCGRALFQGVLERGTAPRQTECVITSSWMETPVICTPWVRNTASLWPWQRIKLSTCAYGLGRSSSSIIHRRKTGATKCLFNSILMEVVPQSKVYMNVRQLNRMWSTKTRQYMMCQMGRPAFWKEPCCLSAMG